MRENTSKGPPIMAIAQLTLFFVISPLRPRLIEKQRYLSGSVQLSSNYPYGGSLSLFGAKPMKSFERFFQRRKICRDRAVVKSCWTI
jgi:hypothetical protein